MKKVVPISESDRGNHIFCLSIEHDAQLLGLFSILNLYNIKNNFQTYPFSCISIGIQIQLATLEDHA